jgi:DNA-binding NarL/FixJ family response regulator
VSPAPLKTTSPTAATLGKGSKQSTIRVLIVDDHGIVRDGLCALLNAQQQMRVVGSAADGMAAVRAAARLRPDVIVMDLALPKLSGIDATLRILERAPGARVIILSASDTSEHVFRALRAGARGYVLKESAAAEIIGAVAAISRGERYLSPRISGLLVDELLEKRSPVSPIDSLSAREREVLHLTVAGATSAEIGEQLSISRKTVDTYRSRTMGKLAVSDIAGLVRFAMAHAMIP